MTIPLTHLSSELPGKEDSTQVIAPQSLLHPFNLVGVQFECLLYLCFICLSISFHLASSINCSLNGDHLKRVGPGKGAPSVGIKEPLLDDALAETLPDHLAMHFHEATQHLVMWP